MNTKWSLRLYAVGTTKCYLFFLGTCCKSSYFSDFPSWVLERIKDRISQIGKKSPSCIVSPYLYERVKPFIFFLSCCHFSGMSCLTSNFELIGDVTVVETFCLSSFEPKFWFTQLGHLICPLSVHVSRWEIFARSYKRSFPDAQIACDMSFQEPLAQAPRI